MLTKNNKTYPWPLPLIVMDCHKKRICAEDAARKLNQSKTAIKRGLRYHTMQVAGSYAHLTREELKRPILI